AAAERGRPSRVAVPAGARATGTSGAEEATPAAAPSRSGADRADTAGGRGRSAGRGQPEQPATPERPSAPEGGRGRPEGSGAPPAAVLDEGDMTAEELASASGCPPVVLQGLESFGLLESRQVGGVAYFGEEALAVARLAAGFASFGVEPRHLRLHKHAVEREAGFIGQVVLPLLKQRNPESRQRAHAAVAELSRLGQDLRAVLLQRALRDQLGG
ncbi:MAG: hypothetical protein KGJ77_07165, partial [Acidobacteriota bacterium]|nr:hypothetical protein [Acidobacteriota bacterium]